MKWRIWPFSNFNPLPSCEGRLRERFRKRRKRDRFQSTPLMRGETHRCCGILQGHAISIHSPHARGDGSGGGGNTGVSRFQSTPLTRGETRQDGRRRRRPGDFNPLPSCEGRLPGNPTCRRSRSISIHSPHARGDHEGLKRGGAGLISIHSPHARGDPLTVARPLRYRYFNPLPSYEGRPFHAYL